MTKLAIVGGGIAGLTAGVYARMAGYDAAIYEKCAVPGGECTGWDRGGYHIDNCIHWLIGTKPGSALGDLWRATGALGDDVEVLGKDHMYTSELNGEHITLWRDADRTEKELLALSPEDAEEITKLMRAVRMARNISIPAETAPELMGPIALTKMALTMSGALKLFKMYAGQDTQDLMNRFKHPLIRCMLSDFCTRESLAHSFPMAYGNFVGGDGGVPRGGSRAMALRMADKFRALGGTLVCNKPAEKIEISGDHATGLLFADGTRAQADQIICACDAEYTFRKLLPESCMPSLLREMYADRAAYPVYGMFQTAIAVDDPRDLLGGEIMMDATALRFHETASDRITIKTFSYEPAFAPRGCQLIQTLTGTSEAGWEYWKTLYQDKDAYRAKKAEIAENTIRFLEARFPEYAGKLHLLDAWTPITYRRYMNAYKGYNQAFTPTKKSARNPYPSAAVEGVGNVWLAGQWINPPGGLPGAATTGKFAIQRIEHSMKGGKHHAR